MIKFRMFRVAVRGLSMSSRRRMDPIQAIFVNKIRAYAEQSAALGGPGILLIPLCCMRLTIFKSWCRWKF